MLTPCPQCGHRLWTEVGSIGAFRMVVFFDDDEESHTYSDQMERCPECEFWLYALAIKPSDLAPQAGGETRRGGLTAER
jgi:hypothetical protein